MDRRRQRGPGRGAKVARESDKSAVPSRAVDVANDDAVSADGYARAASRRASAESSLARHATRIS